MNKFGLMSLAAAGSLALAACAPAPIVRADGTVAPAGSGSGPVAPASSCNVTNVGWATGQTATPEILQRIKAESGASQGRVIPPNTSVTQDFRTDRVNVRIDANRKILSVTCG